MKSYTDIKQSEKLAQILPLESADNVIVSIGYNDGVKTVTMPKETLDIIKTPFSDIRKTIPCWSLSALLNVLPSATLDSSDDHYYRVHCMGRYSEWYGNGVDACYEMIVKLNELKML